MKIARKTKDWLWVVGNEPYKVSSLSCGRDIYGMGFYYAHRKDFELGVDDESRSLTPGWIFQLMAPKGFPESSMFMLWEGSL